jgi:hypothetical protein
VLAIRLTVAGSRDWRYVMLEDPLPAGVEAIQDTSAYPLENKDPRSWWWGSKVEYRDQRTVFFQEDFSEGRYEYVYLVRATSSGSFRAMPAQVSPMYVPDVFASSEPQTLIVTAAAPSLGLSLRPPPVSSGCGANPCGVADARIWPREKALGSAPASLDDARDALSEVERAERARTRPAPPSQRGPATEPGLAPQPFDTFKAAGRQP